jgi:hypothetical protein
METQAGAPPSANSPTRTAEPPVGGFPLAGPSDLPDPRTHAYRQDLADAALAGRVIASHYAEPLERRLTRTADVLAAPQGEAEPVARLEAGARLMMLDNSRGWAWGYAGPDGLVGYVPSDAISG